MHFAVDVTDDEGRAAFAEWRTYVDAPSAFCRFEPSQLVVDTPAAVVCDILPLDTTSTLTASIEDSPPFVTDMPPTSTPTTEDDPAFRWTFNPTEKGQLQAVVSMEDTSGLVKTHQVSREVTGADQLD